MSNDKTNEKKAFPKEARAPRINQRYQNGQRLVVGTVPYRLSPAALPDHPQTLSILLVRSGAHPEWTLPKGGWELHETAGQAAARETYEEAGAIGATTPADAESFGRCAVPGKDQVHEYFPLRVTELKESDWPECPRGRTWMPVADAKKVLEGQERRGDRFVQLRAVEALEARLDLVRILDEKHDGDGRCDAEGTVDGRANGAEALPVGMLNGSTPHHPPHSSGGGPEDQRGEIRASQSEK